MTTASGRRSRSPSMKSLLRWECLPLNSASACSAKPKRKGPDDLASLPGDPMAHRWVLLLVLQLLCHCLV